MADEELEEEEQDEDDEGEEEGSSGGKKKLILIIGLVVLLIIGAVGAAFFTGLLDPFLKPAEEADASKEGDAPAPISSAEATFFDLPELLVNLNAGTRKSTFLKIRVSLELEKASDVVTIQQLMPRVIDNFQVYLRELRIDDLKGSAGMYRLREELLTRVNAAAFPARVNAVLFKEMLVQ